jgi:hypothetical protein
VIYQPSRCDTLLIPTGPSGDHLFTIVTEVCPEGKHLLLNVSSIREGQFRDPTCEVAAGEHPFIIQASYVVYRSPQIQTAERLTKLVDGWLYKRHSPADEALVAKIFAGVGVSRFTPRYVKSYLGI